MPQQEALYNLEWEPSSAPVLQLYSRNKPQKMSADASSYRQGISCAIEEERLVVTNCLCLLFFDSLRYTQRVTGSSLFSWPTLWTWKLTTSHYRVDWGQALTCFSIHCCFQQKVVITLLWCVFVSCWTCQQMQTVYTGKSQHKRAFNAHSSTRKAMAEVGSWSVHAEWDCPAYLNSLCQCHCAFNTDIGTSWNATHTDHRQWPTQDFGL